MGNMVTAVRFGRLGHTRNKSIQAFSFSFSPPRAERDYKDDDVTIRITINNGFPGYLETRAHTHTHTVRSKGRGEKKEYLVRKEEKKKRKRNIRHR